MHSVTPNLGQMEVTHPVWWTAAVMACLADVTTTYIGVALLGIPEQNPLLVALMGSIGFLPALLVSKVVVVGSAIVLAERAEGSKWILPAIPTVMYSLVAVSNITVLLGH